MRGPSRAVDVAMAAAHPAKTAIRRQWLSLLKELQISSDEFPTYLTLSGAEGRDIQLLIEAGLIATTETGAIAPVSENYCVAVENSAMAVLELQRRFPGLRIISQNIQSLLRGESILTYPERGEHRTCCQAHVINLDLQATFAGTLVNGAPHFPVLLWIEKFGALHVEAGHKQWYLLLTLNGTVEWPTDVSGWGTQFLRDNFNAVPEFRTHCERILGAEVCRKIQQDECVDFSALDLAARQRLLLAFVPKAIIERLYHQSWRVVTLFNNEYTGAGGAPMVTYIFEMQKADRFSAPERLYRGAVAGCLDNVGRVQNDGTHHPI